MAAGTEAEGKAAGRLALAEATGSPSTLVLAAAAEASEFAAVSEVLLEFLSAALSPEPPVRPSFALAIAGVRASAAARIHPKNNRIRSSMKILSVRSAGKSDVATPIAQNAPKCAQINPAQSYSDEVTCL